jgi:type II secretory pathway pseudopilin PulG
MKFFLSTLAKQRRGGFSLVESAFSIGLISFGILTLVPLLAVGMKSSRYARSDRQEAQIAETLVEEAKQGTLTPGTTYLDVNGMPCTAAQAAFRAEPTPVSVGGAGGLSRLSLKLTPLGAPDRARTYVVVFQAPQ